jgi:hypothetical protein
LLFDKHDYLFLINYIRNYNEYLYNNNIKDIIEIDKSKIFLEELEKYKNQLKSKEGSFQINIHRMVMSV